VKHPVYMISYGTNPVEPIKNYEELWPSLLYIITMTTFQSTFNIMKPR